MARRVIASAEPFFVLAIAPLLLFPTFRPAWTVIALAGLAILWLARALICREPWPVTQFNSALLLFGLTIPLAVWASAAPELTIPKLTGLILGLAAFRVLAFGVYDRRRLEIGLMVFAVFGAGMWAIGLLGMGLPILQPNLQQLPAGLVSAIMGSDRGINPNSLASVLVIYLPVIFAVALASARDRRPFLAALLAIAGLAAVVTLVVTRSRAGWIGFGVSFALLVVLEALHSGNRRLKIGLLGLVGLTLAGALLAGVLLLPEQLGDGAASGMSVGEVAQQLTLDARVEIWSRALYALQDFPFTGVGLGTFGRVVSLLYPLFLVPPDTDAGHAHNIFLQVGVDQGMGGLIAYLALLIVAGVTAWQAVKRQDGLPRAVTLGLIAALVGLHVYGLADVLELGSKQAMAFWMILGLIAALAKGQNEGVIAG